MQTCIWLSSADAIVSCFSKIQTGFTFLVPAHPGSSGKRAIKRPYVYSSSNVDTLSEIIKVGSVMTIQNSVLDKNGSRYPDYVI